MIPKKHVLDSDRGWVPVFGKDHAPPNRLTVDAETIGELFGEFGPVSVRRMFGGAGIFVDGLMIGLVSDGVIYLKADAGTYLAFAREGRAPFTYPTKNGTHTLTSYWRMPDRLYDDTGELARWARDAHAVALRAAGKKRKTAKRAAGKPAVRRPSRQRPDQPTRPRGRSRT